MLEGEGQDVDKSPCTFHSLRYGIQPPRALKSTNVLINTGVLGVNMISDNWGQHSSTEKTPVFRPHPLDRGLRGFEDVARHDRLRSH